MATLAELFGPNDPPTYVEEWVEGPRQTNFYTRRYNSTTPSTITALFVHGFADHIARYDHVFRRAQENGINVVAWDQRGWGRTVFDEQHRSPSSKYGATKEEWVLTDLEFFLNKEVETGNKVFLWGQSMGGGIVLDYITTASEQGPNKAATVHKLSGVIATAALIKQAIPANKLLRATGEFAAKVFPWLNFPADVPAKDLSHDAAVVASVKADPYMKQYASLICLKDLLIRGDILSDEGWKHWPQDLPLLMLHGQEDKITSVPAAKAFFENVVTESKEWSEWEGSYHEIHNESKIWKDSADKIITWINTNSAEDGTKKAPAARL